MFNFHFRLYNADKQVAAGAQRLDEGDPDWCTRINTDSLSMSCGSTCVMGQLHGGYRKGLAAFGVKWEDRFRLGFDAPLVNLFWLLILRNPWKILKRAWKREIAQRIETAATAN